VQNEPISAQRAVPLKTKLIYCYFANVTTSKHVNCRVYVSVIMEICATISEGEYIVSLITPSLVP
jgi:hypothetical protein